MEALEQGTNDLLAISNGFSEFRVSMNVLEQLVVIKPRGRMFWIELLENHCMLKVVIDSHHGELKPRSKAP